jgi:cobalamin biosynthesis protein CobT
VQVIAASLPPPQPEEKLGECQLNRALVFDDSPEKSGESSGSAVSSSVSLQESSTGSYMDKSSSPEDDSSSAWSIQVHASSEKGDEEELGVEELAAAEYTEEEEEEDDWEEDSDDDCYDDLCEEMSRMTVFDEEEKKATGLPQFEGKHTRFIYNSDDEIEREEVADAAEARAELGALMLRALPVPEGRHLRFHDEEDDEE